MANRWVYRPQNIYWTAQKKNYVDVTTVAIAAPLDIPPLMDQERQQQYLRWRTKQPLHASYLYNHLETRDFFIPGAQTFNQSVSGTLAITDVVGTLQTDLFLGNFNGSLAKQKPWQTNYRTRHAAYQAQYQGRSIDQQRWQTVSVNLTGAFP